MPRLNTYPETNEYGPKLKLLGIIPTTGDEFDTVLLKPLNGSTRRVYIGDSIVGNGFLTNCTTLQVDANGSYWDGSSAPSAPFARTEDYGFAAWAESFIDAPGFIRNSGIGGNTTQQILDRVAADVLAYSPGLVIDNSGTNDIIALVDNAVSVSVAAAEICARKEQLFDLYRSIGARICAPEILPRNAFTSYKTSVAVAVNNWLRQQALERGDDVFRVPPVASIFSDTNSATGGIAAAFAPDGTHPNNLGAQLYGRMVAKSMGGWVCPLPLGLPTMMESFGFDSAAAEIRNSSPLMGTLTAGVAGTGVSGVVAAGYTCARLSGAPTVVASVVADPDGIGNRQRLAITFGAAGEAVEFGIPAGTGRYINGRENVLSCSVRVDIADGQPEIINRMLMFSQPNVGGVVYSVTAMNQQVATGREPLRFSKGLSARLQSPRLLIPSGTAASWPSQFRIYASAAGTITVELSQFAMRLQPLEPAT